MNDTSNGKDSKGTKYILALLKPQFGVCKLSKYNESYAANHKVEFQRNTLNFSAFRIATNVSLLLLSYL